VLIKISQGSIISIPHSCYSIEWFVCRWFKFT